MVLKSLAYFLKVCKNTLSAATTECPDTISFGGFWDTAASINIQLRQSPVKIILVVHDEGHVEKASRSDVDSAEEGQGYSGEDSSVLASSMA